jgi:hypothetical protein
MLYRRIRKWVKDIHLDCCTYKEKGKKWNSMDESRQFEIERGCEWYMKRDVHILLKCSERKEWRERFLNRKCTRLNENQGYKMVSTAPRKKM